MPSFNYFPATYQPFGQSFYQQPVMQQNQAMITNGIIWVGSDAEADAYPIAPNNAVTLWNRTAPIVYVKQADASGKPSIKAYELVERKAFPEASSSPCEASSFATKNDIHDLEKTIQGIKNELVEINKKLEAIKDDDAQ